MRLLIVSAMSHHRRADGRIVGWGPTAQEINHLATVFEDIRHVGPLFDEPAPRSALPYDDNVTLVPVPPSGGTAARDKLGIVKLAPLYLDTIRRELPRADVVHLRCPANIPLLALPLLSAVRRPRYRWMKYAGNWSPPGPEPWSYTAQRRWGELGLHRGTVTINGRWPGQPKHVWSFLNPCLTSAEVAEARAAAAGKQLTRPARMLFVGRMDPGKGADRLIRVLADLRRRGHDVTLDLVGDSPQRPEVEQFARDQGMAEHTRFHGWIDRSSLGAYYAAAHFLVLHSRSEGWAKVLSEAMAYGAVPVATAVSSIPQIMGETGAGLCHPFDDLPGFANVIAGCLERPGRWAELRDAGLRAAPLFTYDAYLVRVREMFEGSWGVRL